MSISPAVSLLTRLSAQRSADQVRIAVSRPHLQAFCTNSSKDQESKPDVTSRVQSPVPQDPPAEQEAGTNDAKRGGDEELKLLFDEALIQVREHGWTDRAIEEAVAKLGWSPAAKRMIARGPVEMVEEFIDRCNQELAETLAIETEKDAAASGGSSPVGRATFAMRTRLEKVEPYHHNWARALALQATPQNSPKAIRSRALLVDEFAHYAGYHTADMSWYTDRAVLGLAYQAAELYWLTDKSPKRADTWRFIENRLRDCHSLRSRITSTYENIMTLSDAATGSMRTIVRSARRSY